jgi:hypothetical protein
MNSLFENESRGGRENLGSKVVILRGSALLVAHKDIPQTPPSDPRSRTLFSAYMYRSQQNPLTKK